MSSTVSKVASSFLMLLVSVSTIFISNAAYANNVTACGAITSPGTYTLQNDVSSSGTCFTILSPNVTLDLNGHAITYDNAAPITITNGTFGTGDLTGWTTTGGPASVQAGAFLAVTESYGMNYALKVPAPTSSDFAAVTSGSYALTAGVSYSASAMMWQPYDTSQSANANIGMTIEIIDASSGAQYAVQSVGGIVSPYTTRGFQYVPVTYTPTANVNVKIRLKVTGATGTLTQSGQAPFGAFYFDDVRLQQTGHYGIQVGDNINWIAATGAVITSTNGNGVITQGQAHGDFSHAINVEQINPTSSPAFEVKNLTITVAGNSTKGVEAVTMDGGSSIHNCKFYSNVDTIELRDHYDGANIYVANSTTVGTVQGSIYNNTIYSGIQTGVYVDGARSDGMQVNVYNNSATLQSRYTDDFAFMSYGMYGANFYGNTVNCGSGNNTCRGIQLAYSQGGSIHDNTISVHYIPNNQEYALSNTPNGCGGAAYGIEYRLLAAPASAANISIYNNTVTANADQCQAAALRFYGPGGTVGPPAAIAPAQNISIYNNTLTALAINSSTNLATSLQIIESYANAMSFTGNTLITNNSFLYVDGTQDYTTSSAMDPDRSLTLDNNTYQLSYPKVATYHPLVDASYTDGSDFVPANVTLSNNTYGDSTVASDFASAVFVNKRTGYTADPYVYNIVITHK